MTLVGYRASGLAGSVAPEQPGHNADHHEVQPYACHLGGCVEGAEALQLEGVEHRMGHGVDGEGADRDRTQQPMAVAILDYRCRS